MEGQQPHSSQPGIVSGFSSGNEWRRDFGPGKSFSAAECGMRETIFEIIEPADENNRLSHIYDVGMIVLIVLSLVPLGFKVETPLLRAIDGISVSVFIVDYLLRWLTADYKLRKGRLSYLEYPFTFMALVDLVSILPSLAVLNRSLKVLRVLRMLRALRVFRVFKAFRYSRNIVIILSVLKKSRRSLITVGSFAAGYILVAALVIFNVEPETFDTMFDAVYWATISLTTVGYGDIYPTSTVGQVITMLSSIFGIAIVALPSGIITARYMRELSELDDD